MSTQARAQIAVLICALFIIWPAVHHVVVTAYGANAWKLGGFAMYATPPARTHVAIYRKSDRQKNLLAGELPAALTQQRLLYFVRRGVLGALLPPDELAMSFFQALPGMQHIEVVVTREMLGARTARIERREQVYKYDRRSTRAR